MMLCENISYRGNFYKSVFICNPYGVEKLKIKYFLLICNSSGVIFRSHL